MEIFEPDIVEKILRDCLENDLALLPYRVFGDAVAQSWLRHLMHQAKAGKIVSPLGESLICLCQTRARDAAAEIKAHTNGP